MSASIAVLFVCFYYIFGRDVVTCIGNFMNLGIMTFFLKCMIWFVNFILGGSILTTYFGRGEVEKELP